MKNLFLVILTLLSLIGSAFTVPVNISSTSNLNVSFTSSPLSLSDFNTSTSFDWDWNNTTTTEYTTPVTSTTFSTESTTTFNIDFDDDFFDVSSSSTTFPESTTSYPESTTTFYNDTTFDIYNNMFGELSSLVELFELFNSSSFLNYMSNISFPHCHMECNFTNNNINNNNNYYDDNNISIYLQDYFSGLYLSINETLYNMINLTSILNATKTNGLYGSESDVEYFTFKEKDLTQFYEHVIDDVNLVYNPIGKLDDDYDELIDFHVLGSSNIQNNTTFIDINKYYRELSNSYRNRNINCVYNKTMDNLSNKYFIVNCNHQPYFVINSTRPICKNNRQSCEITFKRFCDYNTTLTNDYNYLVKSYYNILVSTDSGITCKMDNYFWLIKLGIPLTLVLVITLFLFAIHRCCKCLFCNNRSKYERINDRYY